nr:MAG TPA: Protein of unknown function (DUF1492) [Caudoviricetes sp.]
MTAKEYLRQLKYLDNRINAKLLEREQIRAIAEKTTIGLSEKVQTSSSVDKISDVAVRLVEIEETINKDIDKLVELREEAGNKISRISNDKYKTVLSMYYLSNKTFEEVAELTDMSLRWIYILHGKALKEFEKNFKIVH